MLLGCSPWATYGVVATSKQPLLCALAVHPLQLQIRKHALPVSFTQRCTRLQSNLGFLSGSDVQQCNLTVSQ